MWHLIKEFAIDCGISLGIGIATDSALRKVPALTKYVKGKFGGKVGSDVVGSHIKFKNPGTDSNGNFMQAINRNVMPVEKTGTYGGYGLVNQGKQPTLNSLAKNYGGSESNAFFKPMMSKDTLNNQISGSQLGSISEHQTFNQIGSKEVGQSFNKGVLKSEVERVNLDPQNVHAHELYKQDLKAESAQALRDRIYKAEKRELPEIKDLQDIGFKGQNPEGLKRNNVTGRIQANTDSQNTASYLYRKQVREFQNEIDIRGPSTTQRIKAPGPTLETVFEDGSRILLRAESKTGVAKVEITDTYRNIREKITPLFNNGDLK